MAMPLAIDLNADLGESFGAWRMGLDEALMAELSSCNIACGFHAGDPQVMAHTVALAKSLGVAIGAHPGLPDLQGFGRREMALSPAEVHALCLYQLGALDAFLRPHRLAMHHVKAHGALYHMLSGSAALAAAYADAVQSFDAALKVYGPPQGALREACGARGLVYCAEGFADRAYQADGQLRPRREAGALIHEPEQALNQALCLARGQPLPLADGTLQLRVDTLCVHGDGATALALARSLRAGLRRAGFELRAP